MTDPNDQRCRHLYQARGTDGLCPICRGTGGFIVPTPKVPDIVTDADVETVCQQLYGGRTGERPWKSEIGPEDQAAASRDVRRALETMMQRRAAS